MIAVGIDVSKSKSTIAAISSDGEIMIQPSDFKHTVSDLALLIQKLHSFNDSVKIAMEATGHYHYPILKALQDSGLFVSVINPFLMKKHIDNKLRKGKTDKKDAVRIAFFVLEKSYELHPFSEAEQVYQDLKFLSRQYNQCIRMQVKTRVHLSNLLDEVMPGILSLLHNRTSIDKKNFLYAFITKYESFDKIRNMSERRFVSSYIKLASSYRGRSSQSKALKIYRLACDSITTRSNDTSTMLAMTQCMELLIQCESSGKLLLHQMQSLAYTLPEYPVVLAMNGVGNRLAPRLIAEIGDVRRFYGAKALNAYAGSDAPPFQSGQYESQQRHISKRGSSSLRKACYEVMQALMVHKPIDDPVYQFIIKKEAEGKPKKVAKMAGVNKFLRIYYARVIEIYK